MCCKCLERGDCLLFIREVHAHALKEVLKFLREVLGREKEGLVVCWRMPAKSDLLLEVIGNAIVDRFPIGRRARSQPMPGGMASPSLPGFCHSHLLHKGILLEGNIRTLFLGHAPNEIPQR